MDFIKKNCKQWNCRPSPMIVLSREYSMAVNMIGDSPFVPCAQTAESGLLSGTSSCRHRPPPTGDMCHPISFYYNSWKLKTETTAWIRNKSIILLFVVVLYSFLLHFSPFCFMIIMITIAIAAVFMLALKSTDDTNNAIFHIFRSMVFFFFFHIFTVLFCFCRFSYNVVALSAFMSWGRNIHLISVFDSHPRLPRIGHEAQRRACARRLGF